MAPATAEQLAAQQAQREPSMEEILASIRRIIEDSDTARGSEPAPPQPANLSVPPVGKIAHVPEFVAFSSELGAAAKSEPTETAAAPGPVASEAVAPDMAAATPDLRAEPTTPTFEKATGFAGVTPAPEVAAVSLDDEAEVDPFFDEAELAAALTAEMPPAPSQPPRAAEDVEAVENKPAIQGRATILSEAAGRQVAAAFGELSEAFAASRRRSFDEIAEEMLRPMLQEWLDDNLPTLVERLVREEIERVARGGN